jgi:polysaccharide biosynthesis transport protein
LNAQDTIAALSAGDSGRDLALRQRMLAPAYDSYERLEPEEEDSDGFNPVKLFWYVVHYRWLIAALLLTGLVAGLMFTWMQAPLYRASVKLEVQSAQARVIRDLEAVEQSFENRDLETARQKVLSRDLARRVVYALNLQDNDDFLAPPPKFSLGNLFRRSFGLELGGSVGDLTAEQRESRAVSFVMDGTTANLVRNTRVMDVQFVHARPELAAQVADQLGRSFIDQGVDKVGETSGLARQFIEQQVNDTKGKLEVAERELVEYARANNITATGDEGSLISQNIAALNTSIIKATEARLDAERESQLAQSGNVFALSEFAEKASIEEINKQLVELKGTYQEKLATLKPGFPEMRGLAAQIRELEAQINREAVAVTQSIAIKADQTAERERALLRELAELEKKQAEYQRINIDYTILQREVTSLRSQYDSLISKRNEVAIGADLRTETVSVIDAAVVPQSPHSPRLSINLALSMFLFSVFAGLAILVLELINNTFAVPDQIETDLKVPVLGIIPFVDEKEFEKHMADEKSAISEAYRTLRTSLQFTGTEDNLKTIVVTSSRPSEGKSTTAYKLARDFAAIGRSVLLIDADLRKPRLHRMIGVDNAMGLSNLLTNVVTTKDIDSIFHRIEGTSVTFLRAGTIPPNPADLLLSPKMAVALHHFRQKYDVVIVDSSPVMGLADAPILARQVDATLMVVSNKLVTRNEAKKALSRLKSSGANVVGAAMTRFRIDQVDYNYAYKYMNYNYYSYGDPALQIADSRASKRGGKLASDVLARILGKSGGGGSRV